MAKNFFSRSSNWFLISAILLGISFSSAVFAEDFGEMAGNVTSTLSSVAGLLQGISLIAGIGFAIAAIFKFKQHKDNPTQIPVGTPIALVFIGVALIFLPSLIDTTGSSLFSSPSPAMIGDNADNIGSS